LDEIASLIILNNRRPVLVALLYFANKHDCVVDFTILPNPLNSNAHPIALFHRADFELVGSGIAAEVRLVDLEVCIALNEPVFRAYGLAILG